MITNKRKVLLFGKKVFGNEKPTLSIDYCDIDMIAFPQEYEELDRLSNYDIVILDYAAFLVQGERGTHVRSREQDVFDKQMLEALDNGTTFCFLHYEDMVPRSDRFSSEFGGMDAGEVEEYQNTQIGFRWLLRMNIRPIKFDQIIIHTESVRNEFTIYQKRWGAGKNAFMQYDEDSFDDIILRYDNDSSTGFAVSARNGRIIYLPCQRDFTRNKFTEECLTTLINALITYISRISAELPSWADTPLFPKETSIYEELTLLQAKVDSLNSLLTPYAEAKALPFLSEYEFEEAVPIFFKRHLGLSIFRNEEYKEDFWITDDQSQKQVIVETKTYSRGFKKGGVYAIYNHRESSNLEETFPALLIVNANTNASSWQEKLRPIDRQDYQLAAKNNVLIVRIEDILFFWNAMQEGRYRQEEFLTLLRTESGWLEVQQDGTVVMHK